jgi:hypothetical protein
LCPLTPAFSPEAGEGENIEPLDSTALGLIPGPRLSTTPQDQVTNNSVTPAKAGVQKLTDPTWIPAFAEIMNEMGRIFGYLILWSRT